MPAVQELVIFRVENGPTAMSSASGWSRYTGVADLPAGVGLLGSGDSC